MLACWFHWQHLGLRSNPTWQLPLRLGMSGFACSQSSSKANVALNDYSISTVFYIQHIWEGIPIKNFIQIYYNLVHHQPKRVLQINYLLVFSFDFLRQCLCKILKITSSKIQKCVKTGIELNSVEEN